MEGNGSTTQNREQEAIPIEQCAAAIPLNKTNSKGEEGSPENTENSSNASIKTPNDSQPPNEKLLAGSNDAPKTSQLSVFAKEFVPQFVQKTPTPAVVEQQTSAEQHDPLLDYFLQVVQDITYNPGHYEPMNRQLLSTLNSTPNLDEDILKMMVETIVSQAVWEPNFRYNGARLCNNLARNIQTPVNIPGFRSILLNRCKEIHDDRHNLVVGEAEFLRGFALLLSELYTNMTLGESGVTRRVPIIGKAIRDLLHTLLDHHTPANIKCLCQIMKLCGSAMEDDDRQAHDGVSVDMDELMKNIKTKAMTQVMPMQLNDMLLNLIELRATDWGRAPTTPSSQGPNRPQIPPVYAPPLSSKARGGYQGVFYGPDGGKMLTAEEREFLKQSGVHLDEDEDDYDDQEDDYGGMDDEMAQAFEEFLRMKDKPK